MSSRAKLELLAVALSGIGKILFAEILGVRYPFYVVLALGWCTYLLWVLLKRKDRFNQWGVHGKGFSASCRELSLWGVAGLLVTLLYSYFFKEFLWNPHMLVLMIIYPFWGVLQQILLISLSAGNLKQSGWPKWVVYLLVSILFAAIHWPFWELTIATFVMSLVYTRVFFKYQNILALGLFHGVLGSIFFYLVVQRDPIGEILLQLSQ